MSKSPVYRVYESCVIPSALSKVWDILSPFDFKFLETLQSLQLAEGHATLTEVGSVCTATYTDGNYQTIRLTKLDKEQAELRYEVLEGKFQLPASTVSHKIKLHTITHSSQTFVEFTTDFSSDVSLKDYVDSKFEKRVFCGALKRHLAMHDDAAEWVCESCTYLNPAKNFGCSMCDKEKKLSDSKFYKTLVPLAWSRKFTPTLIVALIVFPSLHPHLFSPPHVVVAVQVMQRSNLSQHPPSHVLGIHGCATKTATDTGALLLTMLSDSTRDLLDSCFPTTYTHITQGAVGVPQREWW